MILLIMWPLAIQISKFLLSFHERHTVEKGGLAARSFSKDSHPMLGLGRRAAHGPYASACPLEQPAEGGQKGLRINWRLHAIKAALFAAFAASYYLIFTR